QTLHQMDGLSHKSRLAAFSTLIFHHSVVFLLLRRFDGGESQVVTQSQPIVAMLGDDIILPCRVTPDEGLITKVLEWTRQDLNPKFVHMRRFGEDSLDDQNPSYKGRTSVSIDNVKQGDMSLKLSKAGIQSLSCCGWTVRESCSLLDLQRQSEVLMTSILSAPE
uniref:Butyrophilin subfamily 1 member A1-like n=1 Tax=Seriola lalandi dorsalis TaxID=1841481 RepID=A0A3B4X779_SERLL